jgi:hypothetical protein
VEYNSLFKDALGRGPDCPPLEEFVELIQSGDEAARRHAATCPHCSSELSLYRAFVEGDVNQAGESPIVHGNPKAGWLDMRHLVPAALAIAAAVMLVTISIGNLRHRPYAPSENSVERSQSIELLSPKGDLKSTPQSLSWNAVPAAVRYQVRLMEVDKTILWETTVSYPSVLLPSQVVPLILPGKRLLWAVDALDAGGHSLVSGAQDFRLQLRHDP